jgi:hypothetical protein
MAPPTYNLERGLRERSLAVGQPVLVLRGHPRDEAVQLVHTKLLSLASFFYDLDFSPIPPSSLGLKESGATYNSADVIAARKAMTKLKLVKRTMPAIVYDIIYSYTGVSAYQTAPFAGWALSGYDTLGDRIVAWRIFNPVAEDNTKFRIGNQETSTQRAPAYALIIEQPLTTESFNPIETENEALVYPEFFDFLKVGASIQAHNSGSFEVEVLSRPIFDNFPDTTAYARMFPHIAMAPMQSYPGGNVQCSFTSSMAGQPYVATLADAPLATGVTAIGTTTFSFAVPSSMTTGVYELKLETTDEEAPRTLSAMLTVIRP